MNALLITKDLIFKLIMIVKTTNILFVSPFCRWILYISLINSVTIWFNIILYLYAYPYTCDECSNALFHV